MNLLIWIFTSHRKGAQKIQQTLGQILRWMRRILLIFPFHSRNLKNVRQEREKLRSLRSKKGKENRREKTSFPYYVRGLFLGEWRG